MEKISTLRRLFSKTKINMCEQVCFVRITHFFDKLNIIIDMFELIDRHIQGFLFEYKVSTFMYSIYLLF